MSRQSVFAEEWRACLREQYKYVVRNNDVRTRESLTEVMHEAGFTDEELAELRVLATMRADEMPEDFVPDITPLKQEGPPVFVAVQPDEADDDISDIPEPADEIEDDSRYALEEDDDISGETFESDDDQPHQLSLFG